MLSQLGLELGYDLFVNKKLKIVLGLVIFVILAILFLLINQSDPVYFNNIIGGSVGKYNQDAYVISFPSSTYMKEDVILYDGGKNSSFPYIGRIVALPSEKFVQRDKTYTVPNDSYYVIRGNYEIDEIYKDIEFTPKNKIKAKVRFCLAECSNDLIGE